MRSPLVVLVFRLGLLGPLGLFNPAVGQAQSAYPLERLETGLAEIDLRGQLPPLDTLVSWALKNNPYLKSFESARALGEGNVALARKAWLDYISLDAGYGYGVFDNLSNQQIAGDPGNQVLFTSKQSRYQTGVSLKMPLSALLNRQREISNTRLESEKFKYEQLEAEQALALKVTAEYNEVLKTHRLLYIGNTMVDQYRAQTARAEIEFANGVINVADYTRLLQMINQSLMELEVQKAEFFKAFVTLENTVGVNLTI